MHRLHRYPCAFLLLLSLTAHLQAQPVVQSREVPVAFDATQARFDHLTVADGLPQNSVRTLLQDHLGFIWIGTDDGLARYDGLTMTVFQDDPDNPFSFRGTGVSVLLEDRAGDLWIGTTNTGLIHYDRATGRFTTYPADPEGTIGPSGNAICFLHEDQRGDIWVVSATDSRASCFLDRFNRATGTVTRFRHDPSNPGSLSSDHVSRSRFLTWTTFAFYEDRSGTIWVGTPGGGLNRFDAETQTFKHYQHDADNPASLSHNFIRSITEDRAGQFWITTDGGGLNRFDPGTETFTPLRHDPDDPVSLASNALIAAYEDRNGALWITLESGLDRLDLDTGTITHFPQDDHQTGSPRHDRLLPIHEDEAGLWFLSDNINPPEFEVGLHYYDRATGTFTLAVNDPEDPSSLGGDVTSFLKDRSGTVWVGSMGEGLSKLDDRPRFPRYSHDPAPSDSRDNRFSTLYEAPSEPGVLWIGTNEGLDQWNRATGDYTHYRHDPLDPRSLGMKTRFTGPKSDVRSQEAFVSDLLEDRAGRFWVTTASGLHSMDRETGRFVRFNPENPDIFTNTQTLAETPDGGLWIGNDPAGLARFDPETQLLTRYLATADTSYHEDFYRALAARKTDGRRVAALLRVGDAVDLTQPFSLDEPAQVMIVAMGEKGSPFWDYGWIEDEAGALIWEMSPVDNRHAGGWPNNRIHGALMHLEAGRYRLRYQSNGAHSYGAWEFPPPLHPEHWGIEVLRVTAEEADTLAALLQKRDVGRISSDHINVLHTDREGLLWIGTRGGGLNRFDPTTETFTTFMDPRSGPLSVSALHEDRAGRLWMGDGEKGLHLIDRERGSIRHYGKRDGLPSNSVYSILEDDEGLLWLGARVGLARFDPEAETFRTYDEAYGLQHVGSGLKSEDGTLLYSGHDGITVVDLNLLADDPIPPEVALTGFDLFNASAAIGPDAPLQADVSVAEQITLAHDENDFTFHFSALHYTRPEENTAAYRLEPYEEDWVAGGLARSARYTNLSPGTYTFRVKAANADGVWNEEGASIRLTIAPPWWRTWWAYGFYGVLLLGGLFAVDRLQRKRLIRQERERTQARELEQARAIEQAHTELQQSHYHLKATQAQLIQSEKMASLGQLTAGIAHEIKNPLNFVNNFAEVNEELADELREALANGEAVDDILDDLKQNAQVIAQHGKRADGIVHAMMQHASGGSGQREATDVNALVEEQLNLAYHGRRAQGTGFNATLERNLDAKAGTVDMVPQEIGRVLLNLLSNAFDAVHEHAARVNGQYAPTVTVSTKRDGDQIEMRVSDNGPGIPKEIQEKIFEPFFTTKPTGSGTGLGLSLSYDIVTQGHGGTLTVESTEGEGATFAITLPHEAKPTDGVKAT